MNTNSLAENKNLTSKGNKKKLINEIDDLIEAIDKEEAIITKEVDIKKSEYQIKLYTELEKIYTDLNQSIIENQTMYQATQSSLLDQMKLSEQRENYFQPKIIERLQNSIDTFKEKEKHINNFLQTKLIYKKIIDHYINLREIIPPYETVCFAKKINPYDSNEKTFSLFNINWIFSFKHNHSSYYGISIKNLNPFPNVAQSTNVICNFTIKRGEYKCNAIINEKIPSGSSTEIAAHAFVKEEEIHPSTYIFKIGIRYKSYIDQINYNNIDLLKCSQKSSSVDSNINNYKDISTLNIKSK